MSEKLITVTEAMQVLAISKKKMAALLAEGSLVYRVNPLDKRVKLVRYEEVLELLRPQLRKAA